MLALGYNEYGILHIQPWSIPTRNINLTNTISVVQGGDLGSAVARILALKYGSTHCKAHHINNAAPAEPTLASHPALYAKLQSTPLTPTELAGLERTAWFATESKAFYALQSTKPQTLAYSLTDSPVGLLAWIYEKLRDWTDSYAWTDDELLTWISIYYFSTAGPAASLNIYYENEHRKPLALFPAMQEYIADVPLGIARFPKDLVLLPKLWCHTMGPVVLESEYDKGGHFAAWERPDAVVGDLRKMFGKSGGAYGCVEGKSGYSSG